MNKKNLIKALLVILLLAFAALAVRQAKLGDQVKLKNKIELRSKEAQLIELNTRYDKVIELKTNTEKEKQEQLEQIKQLETEKAKLESDLQAKLNKQQQDAERLTTASKRATGTNTVYAAGSGCEGLRTLLAAKGISGAELNAAVELGRVESGCQTHNNNPSSNACNYFQELPCGKWGGNHNVDAHLDGAIRYAQGRYGSFQNALNTWHGRSPHWW